MVGNSNIQLNNTVFAYLKFFPSKRNKNNRMRQKLNVRY